MPRHRTHTTAPVTHPRKGIGAKMKIGSASTSSARSRTRSGVRGSEVTEAGDDQGEAGDDAREEAGDPERDRRADERAEPEADRRAEDHRRDDQAAGVDRDSPAPPRLRAGSGHRRSARWSRSRAWERRRRSSDGPGGTLETGEPARRAGPTAPPRERSVR